MAKAVVVLGLVISLVGGIAPRLIRADGNLDVVVRGEADVAMAIGESNDNLMVHAKTPAKSKAAAKNTTKARVKKGNKTMTTINSITNGVGNASSLPGE